MLASEDASQQPLHFLQSCGFGGLWRFAGPFTKVGSLFKLQKKNDNDAIARNAALFIFYTPPLPTVQHDGGVVRAVRQLPGGDGGNVSAGGGKHPDATVPPAVQSQLQPEQPHARLADG